MSTFSLSHFTILILLSSFFVISESGSIAINYGRIADNLPPPPKVVELLKSHGFKRTKLYDTDSSVLNALANSGISVVVSLPNDLLDSAANDQSFADNWVQSNISPYYPKTQIEAIAVGNEVFASSTPSWTQSLVPAMKNIHSSLSKYNLDSSIKISSPIAFSAFQSSYPPSSGSFKPDLIEPVMKPMLDFLRQTGSYLMANVYPFFAYSSQSKEIPLDYALFRNNPGSVDSGNGLRYFSLFDAQVDAVFAAMSAIGYDDVKMVITETGWPSKGDENEIGASVDNAASYNGNLVKRVLNGNGTPLRPQELLDVYLFALFNENQKHGLTSERNYGLFYPDEQKVYDIPLTIEGSNTDTSTQVNGPNKEQITRASEDEVKTSSTGQTWCVANTNVGKDKLQVALNYACGEGGADCRPIKQGSTCFDPNSLEAHASYAFNSFYQMKARATGTCDFGGAAYVVTQPPKFGKCEFPTGY